MSRCGESQEADVAAQQGDEVVRSLDACLARDLVGPLLVAQSSIIGHGATSHSWDVAVVQSRNHDGWLGNDSGTGLML